MSPTIDGNVISVFYNHDNIPKTIIFILEWVLLIGFQLIYLFCLPLWFCVDLIFALFWIFVGLCLFQLKIICVKKIWNEYIMIFSGSRKFRKSLNGSRVDTALLNESIVTEFVLETIPQLTTQGINNTYTNQWETLLSV